MLGSGDDGADVVALDGDASEAEGGVEFIGVADGVEPGVVLGDPAAEEEIGLAGVAAAGRDGERHEAQLTFEEAAGLLRRCRGRGSEWAAALNDADEDDDECDDEEDVDQPAHGGAGDESEDPEDDEDDGDGH